MSREPSEEAWHRAVRVSSLATCLELLANYAPFDDGRAEVALGGLAAELAEQCRALEGLLDGSLPQSGGAA